MKIEQGQIWEVVTDKFMTTGGNHSIGRPVNIRKGEKIEIRYPYAWHFRTEDNQYFHAIPSMIKDNCRCIGAVLPSVWSNNIAKLEEILRLKLYSKEGGK